MPSPASGILTSIKVAEDETVEVGVELAVISDAGEASADAGAAAETAEAAPAEVARSSTAGSRSRTRKAISIRGW